MYDPWRARAERGPNPVKAQVIAEIRAIAAEHQGTYTNPRITHDLRRRGYCANHKRMQRLMGELGISATAPRRFVRTTRREEEPPLPDLVGQDFAPGEPGRRYVSDITYVRTSEGLATSPRCWTLARAGPWAGHSRTACPITCSPRPSTQRWRLGAASLVRCCTAIAAASTCPGRCGTCSPPSGCASQLAGWPPARQRGVQVVLRDPEARFRSQPALRRASRYQARHYRLGPPLQHRAAPLDDWPRPAVEHELRYPREGMAAA